MKPDFILFPDASLKRRGSETYAGYACVVLNPNTMEYVVIAEELSKNATIVFGEAWAAYRGLQFVRRVQRRDNRGELKVLVISDSKMLVNTFSVWINVSWDTSDWNRWKKKDGSTVKNQGLYRKMLGVMNRGPLTVRFVHINSHSDKKQGLRAYIKQKMREARVRLNDKQLDVFVQLNSVADKAACDITKHMVEADSSFDHMNWIKHDK